jgi:hypothetical protein
MSRDYKIYNAEEECIEQASFTHYLQLTDEERVKAKSDRESTDFMINWRRRVDTWKDDEKMLWRKLVKLGKAIKSKGPRDDLIKLVLQYGINMLSASRTSIDIDNGIVTFGVPRHDLMMPFVNIIIDKYIVVEQLVKNLIGHKAEMFNDLQIRDKDDIEIYLDKRDNIGIIMIVLSDLIGRLGDGTLRVRYDLNH